MTFATRVRGLGIAAAFQAMLGSTHLWILCSELVFLKPNVYDLVLIVLIIDELAFEKFPTRHELGNFVLRFPFKQNVMKYAYMHILCLLFGILCLLFSVT